MIRNFFIVCALCFSNTACSLSSPMKGPLFSKNKKFLIQNNQTYLVAVTNVILCKGPKKRLFMNYTTTLYKDLKNQPGYLGGSLRRKFFGNEAWTMTIWKDQKSMNDFVNSKEHLNAIYMSSDAIEKFRTTTFQVHDKSEINWNLAIKKIEGVNYKIGDPLKR